MQRQVPGLGLVHGISSSIFRDIEQYNGIPYGEYEARFRQARLVTAWPGESWDATRYGPICPFPRMVIGFGLTQARLSPQHDYDLDEFKCLNLNITCPRGSRPDSAYPVMLFVHGGGNCVGMGSDPGYNGGPLVNFAVKNGLPIIVVTIKHALSHTTVFYRLGAFGFLASEEIKGDNEAAGDKGYGNYAIRDQLLAYQWVKKNIQAFGGDPERVTGVGHSAGSIDTHILISSPQFAQYRPFKQAILQSGVSSRNVRSLTQQQKRYDSLAAFLKIGSSTSGKSTLQALRDVPAEELVNAYIALGSPVSSWQATVDGFFVNNRSTAATLSSIEYPPELTRILLGDTQHEGLIFGTPIKQVAPNIEKVQSAARQALGEVDSARVLEAYGVTPEQTPGQLFEAVVKIVTDGAWSQPIEAVARSFPKGDVFYYNVSATNPFDGPNKDTAHHGIDLLLNFLTYQSLLPTKLATLAETYALHWILFINSKQPYTPYSQKSDGSSIIMMYGRDGAKEVREDSKPTYKTLRLCEKLQDSFSNFESSLRGGDG